MKCSGFFSTNTDKKPSNFNQNTYNWGNFGRCSANYLAKSTLAVIRDDKYLSKCVIIYIIYLNANISNNNYLG